MQIVIFILNLHGKLFIHSPFFHNTKKRLVKAPRIYLSDHGILNALLQIRGFGQLSGHPVLGSLWESVVLSNLQSQLPGIDFYFYRTSNGAELDFICTNGSKTVAIECKATLSPVISKGSCFALKDTGISKLLVVAPVEKGWRKSENTFVVSLSEAVPKIRNELEIVN